MALKHPIGKNTKSEITNVTEKQIQPNAVDIRLDRLFKINNESEFIIDETQKTHRGSVEVPTVNGYYVLLPNTSYEFLSDSDIEIGENEASSIITRSTLNRNGLFITSGLYDTGFKGTVAGVIHNNSGLAKISKGCRVGQVLIWESESLHSYDGDYGTGKLDEELYNKQ